MLRVDFDKNWLGDFLGDLFTNSSVTLWVVLLLTKPKKVKSP
jgi:hypothetical protein